MASITSEIASSSSSSSSSLPKCEYDVFLSFRGEDTRNNFTDHLYAALDRKGIWTFRDDERLERGKPISTELLNAIEKSKFAIIVLSRNYASSSWCLDELVKIVECKEKAGLTVLPVFYGVDPSDVRKQTGSFAEAFAKHELMKNEEKLQSWRAALTQVANLSGWDTRNKKESTIIEEIARKLIGGLPYSYLNVHEDLVGIQSRVEEMENLYLSMGLNDVHFIGIWGMGGIGKTTIARVLYDRIRYRFDGSSFLANIREKSGNVGLVTLQKQLLSDVLFEKNIDIWNVQRGIKNRFCHKRVLVILDDVDQLEQLEALAGKQSWFGPGSVIIITTRDQHLLIEHGVAEEKIYEAKILNYDEALKVFSLKAFKQDNPLECYKMLSKEFVYYAQGLPLALKVLGSFLLKRNLDAWESLLGRLKETPERKIMDVLRISFNCLRETEKKIFLDIACFFKGMTKDRVVNILRTPHSRPIIEIDVLVEKTLIIISEGTLWMHDLIQELGKEIVRCESPDKPGGRSRLWIKEDVLKVLKDNTGTEKVEGIFINTSSKEEDLNVEEKVEDLNAETFSEMRNLRLLKICNVGLPQGLNSLSSDLRLMDWPECPLKSMPKNFNPDKLVELIMPRSLIKQLWEGNWSLKWLRIIDLSDSRELIMTLDFARVPNLEKLILKGCTKLSTIQASLGDLKHLILLDLSNCTCLESLPGKISWESLEIFILSGCSKLKKFPKIVGNMSRLLVLNLNETAIEDLPSSMEQLTGLIKLDLTNCKKLSSLPRVIYSLTSLNTLTLSSCSKLHKMEENLGNLKGLKNLDMSGTGIRDLPLSMEQITGLIKLDLTNCKNLSTLPEAICSLTSLKILTLSCLKLDKMPMNLGNLKGLEELDISGTAIIEPPASILGLKNLKILSSKGCKWSWKKPLNFLLMKKTPDLMGLVMPSLSGLCSLTRLNIRNCNLQAIPSDIGCLSSLQVLDLSGNNFICLPESINQLSKLREFWVENCKSLQLLPELQLMNPYNEVFAYGCTSLESFLPVKMNEKSSSRSSLYLLNCLQFDENQGRCDLFTTMLREYFQEMCYRKSTIKGQFDVFLPGSEVPNWFRHRSVGASINLEVTPYLFKKFRGIALCAVFRPHQHRRIFQELLVCTIKANGKEFPSHPVVNFSEEINRVESDLCWFMYLFHDFFKSDHPYATEFFHQIANGSSCQLEIEFKPNCPYMLEMKKCGAHMVYEEEMEDLKQSMGQSECSSSIISYNEGVDHFEEDIKSKRSRDDENGASGEGSSTHLPHPKTK